MARPVDPERRRRLLAGIVDYVTAHGLNGLSLRPLADALDVDPPLLLYHFGSKEQLIIQILSSVRDRQREVLRETQDLNRPPSFRTIWNRFTDPRNDRLYRLFIECYALALSQPTVFSDFLDHVVDDWLAELDPELGSERATLVIAAARGLILDLLATGDRDRVIAAAELLGPLLH